jgi:broad specificity phosphatase PhoE
MPTTIHLLRHAQAFNNVAPSGYVGEGLRDAALTVEGYEQTKLLKPQLASTKFDAIYCSPLKRCRQTLKEVYPRAIYRDVKVDDRLLEQPYGLHISNHRQEYIDVQRSSPKYWDCTNVAKENPFRVLHKKDEYEIIRNFIKMIVQAHANQTVLIVSHGRWISRFLKIFYHMAHVHISNCECLQVIIDPSMIVEKNSIEYTNSDEQSNKRQRLCG